MKRWTGPFDVYLMRDAPWVPLTRSDFPTKPYRGAQGLRAKQGRDLSMLLMLQTGATFQKVAEAYQLSRDGARCGCYQAWMRCVYADLDLKVWIEKG